MKSSIGNCEGVVQLRVRPESPAEVEAVQAFIQAIRYDIGSVIVFLDQEPDKRAMSITPSSEIKIN